MKNKNRDAEGTYSKMHMKRSLCKLGRGRRLMEICVRTLAAVGCALACAVAFALQAGAATIDFEGLPGMANAIVPVPVASQLSDQFLSTLGVRFSSGSPYVAVVNLGSGHATSGVNALAGSTPDGLLTYDARFPIVATFFDPSHPATPATTDHVSLRLDLDSTSGQNVVLRAFNLTGQLINSSVMLDTGGATLEVSAPGIHSVQFTGTADSTGAAIDDFTFNPVVPVSMDTSGQTYFNDFDGVKILPAGVVDSLTGAGVVTGVQGYGGVAPGMTAFAGNMMRDSALGDPAPAITLTLSNLPPHNALSLGFLLAVIDSWDGQSIGNPGAPDYLNVQLDGTAIFHETFANDGRGQSYGGWGQLAYNADLGFNRPGYVDAAYDMGAYPQFQNIPHRGSTLTLSWFASGAGWQGGDDESFGIDNLQVVFSNSPLFEALANPGQPSFPTPDNLLSNAPANTVLSWNYSDELLVNAGFELGDLTGWSQVSKGPGNFIINNGGVAGIYEGSYNILGQQTGPATNSICQDVAIPASAVTASLSWAHLLVSDPSNDWSSTQFRVEIQDTNGVPRAVAFTTAAGTNDFYAWYANTFDLTPFIGQTIRVAFILSGTGPFTLGVNIDAVSLDATYATPPRFDVYFGTNPSPGAAEFQGTTTNTVWRLPRLTPLTTYYWKIASRRDQTNTSPVWQFTTRGVDHFAWTPIASPQVINQPFPAIITARDEFNTVVSNFTGTVNLSGNRGGGLGTNTILGDLTYSGNAFNYDLTLGYSFTPTTNLTVTHFRHYFGVKVSLWTDSGTLVASQPVVSSEGTWRETALAVPVTLLAGQTYRVGVYTGPGGNLYGRYDVPSMFTAGIINQSLYNSGDSFPSGGSGWQYILVDLRYTIGASIPVALTPLSSASFTNGSWSGPISVNETGSGVVLQAADSDGHSGLTAPFDVLLTNDVALSVLDTPNPVAIGADLTYTLTVANAGPATATGLTLTNFLPANASLASFSSSQGSCSSAAGAIQCDLGSLAAGASATVTIVVNPLAVGFVTNLAVVGRSGADPTPANNTALNVTAVTPPSLSISDVSVLEGDTKTTTASFNVVLSGVNSTTVTVSYNTFDGTAQSGTDYNPVSGTLTFSPGVSTQTVRVQVIGDLIVEGDETFYVSLNSPVNAVLGRAQATGTILNDDGLPGKIDHFGWDAIASPQLLNVPFAVTISALDAFGEIATNFSGTVGLRAFQATGLVGSGGPGRNVLISGGEMNSTIQSYLTALGHTSTIVDPSSFNTASFAGFNAIWLGVGTFNGLVSRSNELVNFVNAGGSVLIETAGNHGITEFPFGGQLNGAVYASGDSVHIVNPSHPLSAGLTDASMSNWGSSWHAYFPSLGSFTGVMDNGSPGNWVVVTLHSGAGNVVFTGLDPAYHIKNGSGPTGPTSAKGIFVNNALRQAGGTVSIPISPTNTASFSNGIWTGNLTVQAPGSNVVVIADDGNGHTASANHFAVLLHDDIGVSIKSSPEPVTLGEQVTYTITVTNVGPSAATGVSLTDLLATGATFVSATSSQGSCVTVGKTTTCNLDTLPPDSSATLTVVATAGSLSVGLVANRATVTRAEPDAYAANNTMTLTSTVQRASISVLDVSLFEGDSGVTNAEVHVQLSPVVTSKTVRIDFSTADGSGTDGSDYIGTNGTLIFLPGETDKTILVPVLSDPVWENDETFFVNLANATNALLVRSNATVTILNDDAYPQIGISNASMIEGDSGTQDMLFNVSLWPPSSLPVSFQYYTGDASAQSGSDFLYTNAILTLAPGQTNATIAVTIFGDLANELDEFFYLYLCCLNNASYSNGISVAIGTIINDDTHPTFGPAGYELIAESCGNGAIDPGETVTVNLALQNISPSYAISTNLTAVLLASDQITSLSVPQNYGAIAPGDPPVSRPFTFIPNVTCGAPVTVSLRLKDGPFSLGTVTYTLPTGRLGTSFSENFDRLSPPALPPGWTAAASGAGIAWRTVTTASDTAPTAVYANDPGSGSDNRLTSPLISINSSNAQLSFNHSFSTENCCDYCTVEIAIDGGAFNEILNAGGSFAQNGYNNFSHWSGSSGGFIPTIINFPPSVAGHQVQLSWHLTSDGSVSGAGWWVDTVAITDTVNCCLADDLAVTTAVSPTPVPIGVDTTYTITVANTGPSTSTGVVLSNTLPAKAALISFSSSQGSCSNFVGTLQCALGDLAGGSNAVVTVVVHPSSVGTLTNIAVVSRNEPDPNTADNTSITFTPVTLAALSIGNASVTEGDIGVTPAVFTVTLLGTHSATVTVQYSTTNGTALAGTDYFATNGTVSFGPGVSNQTITVLVRGDILIESNKNFFVNLSTPVNSVIAPGGGQGTGTIIDDDGLPGHVDHFVWDIIPSPQYLNTPFAVTVTALDAFGAVVTNFTDTVTLSGIQDSRTSGSGGAGRNVLISGTEMNSDIQADLTALGHTSTIVSPASFGSASFAGFDAIWLGAFTPFNGALSRSNDLVNFVTAGGVLLMEADGANPLNQFPFGGQFTAVYNIGGDTVHIVNPTHPLSAGLTDAAMSNWASSYHSYFTSIGTFTGVMDNGTPGNWVVVTMPVGAGNITYTGLDPSFHIKNGAGATGPTSPKGIFVNNALRQSGMITQVAIDPTVSAGFSNGVWMGLVTVQTNGTNIHLKATDVVGHAGSSSAFNVFVPGDVTLSLSATPNSVSTNTPISYTLNLFNPGPAAATGVLVSNVLPAGASFLSASSSLGACSNAAGVVVCNLGTLPAAGNATINIVALSPLTFGRATDFASVTFNESDPVSTNNVASVFTTVLNLPPTVTLTAPFSGAFYQFPVDIPVAASASDPDGSVAKVEFFNNGIKIGESTNNVLGGSNAISGFSIIWSNANPGIDVLTAKATDNLGKAATSGPVAITINPPPPGNGQGLFAEYFDNIDFTASSVSRVDSQVYFDLSFGGWPPAPVAPTTFSTRWSGTVVPFYSDTYTFYTTSDDGVRLYVNGQLLINHFNDHTAVEDAGTIDLKAGQPYSIRMEYFQDTAAATASLSWSSTNQFKQLIPQSQLNPLPIVGTNPVSRNILIGNNVTFTVLGFGQGPISYQWLKNASIIPGAVSNRLTLTNLQVTAAGGYSVMLSNVYGVSTSAVATLNVGAQPVITEDPQSQIVLSGSNIFFRVSATGSLPLGYRWRKPPEFSLLTNYILNASNSIYSISNVRTNDAGTYHVAVTNIFGQALGRPTGGLSSNAYLTVVSSDKTNLVAMERTDVTLLAQAFSPNQLNYQWRFNLSDLPGATNDTLVLGNIQPGQAGDYSVVVTDTPGSVTALVATVTVELADLDQNGLPDDWEMLYFGHTGVDPNADPDGDTMSNMAEYIAGTNPTDGLSYLKIDRLDHGSGQASLQFSAVAGKSYSLQLKEAVNLGRWTKFADVDAAPSNRVATVLDPFPPTAMRIYRLLTPKLAATDPGPAILMAPRSVRVNPGDSASFSVFAAGSGPLNYQWLFNGDALASMNSSNLSLGNVQFSDAGSYSVRVTDSTGSQTSDPALLGIYPVISMQPVSQSAFIGSNVTFSVSAVGGGPLSYRWRKDGITIPGQTNSVLQLFSVQPSMGGNYSVVVTAQTPEGRLSTISSNAVLNLLRSP